MLGRNEPCHCKSGKKYKKCCLNSDLTIEPDVKNKIGIPLTQIPKLVKDSYSLVHIIDPEVKQIRVQDVFIVNTDVLQIDFEPYALNSPDIKGEIAGVIGVLNGLFRGDALEHADFSHYAIRGFDEHGEEIISALCSIDSARMIGNGNSINWLKSTLFIENTPDYRLSVAKKLISEIENGLRHAVTKVLLKSYGEKWWDKCLNNKMGNSVKSIYENQFNCQTTEGNVLINYTYTLGLKKIIETFWPEFKHLFLSKINFSADMKALNDIRKEEAHNRTISSTHISELQKLHETLLEKISNEYPLIFSRYLVDNWRNKLKEIMMFHFRPKVSIDELESSVDPGIKLVLLKKRIVDKIEYLQETEAKLESVVVPTQKKSQHKKLIMNFNKLSELYKLQLNALNREAAEDIESSIIKIERCKAEMNSFADAFLLSES